MLSFGDTLINRENQETLEHGTAEFPVGCYYDDLTRIPIPWHWHEELEVGYVAKGSLLIDTPNHPCQVEEGDAFFINSGIMHMYQNRNPNKGECHLNLLVFHPRLIGGTMDSVFWSKYIRPLTSNSGMGMFHFGAKDKKRQNEIIKRSWMECVKEDYGYEMNVRYLLSQLFLYMNQEGSAADVEENRRALHYNERMKKMLTYLEQHQQEPLTVSMIAGSAAISESECLRCFRKVLGTSPIAYLKTYRLQNAASLLTSTQWKVSYIAEKCGFHDMSYFSKSFKRVYQCTPQEYRTSYIQKL